MALPKKTVVRRTPMPESISQPVVTPIYPSVVYSSASADQLDAQYEGDVHGYTYAREGHPNASVLASKIDVLENASGGIITSSGMAAISTTVLALLKQGDHIVASDQLYGRTWRMLKHDLPKMGINTTFVDPTDGQAITAAVTPDTKMLMFEVVANPTLRIADVTTISKLAQQKNILLVIDNTFTTPIGFSPYEHGADVVIHSVTKLMGGHSDVTLGYVAAKKPEHQKCIYDTAVTWGFTPSPFDCWLAERGLHSFELRFDRAQSNAMKIADFLSKLPGVASVLYPGQSDHPDHDRAKQVLGEDFGNMVSFVIRGGRAAANALINAAPQIPFAPTLGDVATTLSHPASSSHRGLTESERKAIGIDEGFFRLSVGIEDSDLICDELSKAIAEAVA